MTGRVVVLTGGIGGAKLVVGLTEIMPREDIVAIVNTGDDFTHLGLHISPDLDTLLYTLAGKANPTQGWGRAGESWSFMDSLKSLNGQDWFLLGDGDLALHVLRTSALASGGTLDSVTSRFAEAWDVGVTMLPMSNERVGTHLDTDEGYLPFQRYFVERRCEPAVRSITFEGAETARPGPGVIDAIMDRQTQAILIAPSNPYLSVDPILAIPDIRAALENAIAPVVAVSPIIGGAAVKGPTAKLMAELGIDITSAAIARHYEGILDGLLLDDGDSADGVTVAHASSDILMTTLADRARVARESLALAKRLAG